MHFFAQGDALVTADEFRSAVTNKNLSTLYHEFSKGSRLPALKFSTGELNVENIITSCVTKEGAKPVPFQPIGLGKPLTIQIRKVYTGKHPSSFLGNHKDMLMTSAIKSITSFDAKPLAINFLLKEIASKSHINRPPASNQGTPFIFYSPALLEKSLTLDLSIVFDNFPDEAFKQVGRLFTEAAGIPIFLTYNVYLLAAGLITNLVGKVGEMIFDGDPEFSSSDGIDIFWPGCPPIPPGFMLITGSDIDRIDPEFRTKYRINQSCNLVDASNREYDGDIPFVIISLDGTPQEELKSFAPTAASAALLTRFYGMKDKQEQSIETLLDAVKIYNDYHFRQQIDRMDAQISALTDGDPKKTELKEKRSALVSNICDDILKPR